MVIRVVPVLLAAVLSSPAAAESLPYDIMNFFRTPAHNPEIAYDVSALLYDRTPDHLALGYRVGDLTGSSATHRVIRDYGPLDYNTDGLLAVIIAEVDTPASSVAAD